MNSSDHFHHDNSGSERPTGFSKPKALVSILKTDRIQINLKTFVFALKQNSRGLFLSITEGVNGRQNTIIIPANGLEEFRSHFDDLLQSAKGAIGEVE